MKPNFLKSRYKEHNITEQVKIFNDDIHIKFPPFDSDIVRGQVFDENVGENIVQYLYFRILQIVSNELATILASPSLLDHEDEISDLLLILDKGIKDVTKIEAALIAIRDASFNDCYIIEKIGGWTISDIIGSIVGRQGQISIGLLELALHDNDQLRK